MSFTTPRLALPYPQGFDVDNVPSSMLALATKLDNSMLGFSQGTLASRPAGGTVYGKYYFATDTLQLSQYLPADSNNAAGWRTIGTMPTKLAGRWFSTTQQMVAPANPQVKHRLNWGFGPGSGFAGTYPNYFDGSSFNGRGFGPGPVPTMPVPGSYRVHGQAAFYHLGPYGGPGSYPINGDFRLEREAYLVWVYRGDGVSAGTEAIGFWQVNDHWQGPPSFPLINCPTVPFDCLVDLDFSDAQHSCISVWIASSSELVAAGQVMEQTIGGPTTTYLEVEYENSL